MKLKILFLFLMITLIGRSVHAQEFRFASDDVTYSSSEDYRTYNQDILQYIEWLKTHGPAEEENWGKYAGYFIKWLEGTPDVDVIIPSQLSPYLKDSPVMLIYYMAGYTEAVLKNPSLKNDKVAGTLAGIRMMLHAYKKNWGGNGKLKKLLKAEEKGKLEKMVRKWYGA